MVSLPEESKLQFKIPKQLQTICLALVAVGLVLTVIQAVIALPGGDAHHGGDHHAEAADHGDAAHAEDHAADENGDAAHGEDHAVAEEHGEEDHGEHHGYTAKMRFFYSLHLALLILIPLSLSGVYFSAYNHLSGAAWSVTVRRVAENFFWGLPVAFVLLLVILFLGIGDVFHHWVGKAESDHLIAHKEPYLNVGFFTVRNIIIFLVWMVFGYLFWRWSTKQDEDGKLGRTKMLARLGGGFLVVFGLTYSVSTWDLAMSLYPHWFSTLWALYIFAGLALTLFATLILWTYFLKKAGYYGDTFNENHFHDLGKFMFGHTIFWAYMAVSQYLLIWYGHIPEVTTYYKYRTTGGWYYVTFFLVIARFAIPFFALVRRDVKRNWNYMAVLSAWILFGQVLDMYWIVYPTLDGHGAFIMFSWQELGPLLMVAGAFIYLVAWGLSRNSLIPKKDPRLEECLHFHQ